MRLFLLSVIAFLLLFAGYEYNRIEAQYKTLEDEALYIFYKCKEF